MHGLAHNPQGSDGRDGASGLEDLGAARLHGHGPVCAGRLTVREGVLRFVADAAGSALVGRADRALPLGEITGLRRDGASRLRVLGPPGEAWILSVGAPDRLEARLRILQSHAAVSVAGGPVVPTLVDALTSLRLGDEGPLVMGRLVVDARRLRFAPASPDDADLILDVDVLSLGAPRLSAGPTFSATLLDRELQVPGPTAAHLFSVVVALQGGTELDAADAPVVTLRHARAWFWRGPVWCEGTLVLGPQQLQFLPDDPGENILGIEALTLPTEEVGRVALRGWPRKRMVIAARDGRRWRLGLGDAGEQMGLVLACLHDGQRHRARSVVEREALVARALAAWGPVLPLEGEEVLLGVPVVRASDAHDLSPGVLVVTRRRVLFLPDGGPAGPAPAAQHRVADITREHSGELPTAEAVRFRSEGRVHCYVPTGGPGLRQRFWDRCRAPSRIIPVDPGSRSLQQLDGPARFVRLRQIDGVECKLSPASLVRTAETWALVLPAGAGLPLVAGRRLTVELGRADGVVQFDTELVGPGARELDLPPSALPPSLQGAHRQLLLHPPAVVRLFNQRRAFRVAVELDTVARPAAVPEAPAAAPADAAALVAPELPRIGLRLLDLSTGGCAAHASCELAEGTRIDLRLPLSGREVHTAARVLRVERPDEGQPRYGLRFEGLRQVDEDLIHRHVLACQRAELAIPA